MEFDESNCTTDCPALCDHFESWYRKGMSEAWSKIGKSLKNITDTMEN